jgi:uncharacterized tellurite resistance protein B-like protein
MEGVFLLLAFIFGPMILKAMFASGSVAVERGQVKRTHGDMSIRVRSDHVTLETGASIEMLLVEMKGLIPKSVGTSVGFIHLEDNLGRSVQCIDQNKQEPTTVYFQEVVKANDEVFAFRGDAFFTDWVTIAAVPTIFLLPADSKQVQLRARLRLHQLVDSNSVPIFRDGAQISGAKPSASRVSGAVEFEFKQGYLSLQRNRERALEASMKLGVAASAADGNVQSEELDVIREAAKRHCDASSDGEAMKLRIQGVVRDALASVKSSGQTRDLVRSATEVLREIESEALSIEAIELCVQVLAADGEADEREMDFVYRLCDRLEVPRDLVREMLTKKVATEDLIFSNDNNPFSVLGIDAAMSHDEIRSALNQAFRKWNSLVNSDRVETASRATEMLELIGRARREFLE